MSDDEISALPKMTAYADRHFILAQVVRFFCEIIENIMGKGENAGYQHFLLFPKCFEKDFLSRASKGVILSYKFMAIY